MDDLGQFLEFLFEILFAYFAICQTKYLNFLPCRFHKSRLEFFALQVLFLDEEATVLICNLAEIVYNRWL
jgi:hypothetical protein